MLDFKSPLPTPPLPSLLAWVLGAFLLAAIDSAEGQTTDAICNSTSWTWSFNSKKQSPCLVAAYLLAPCHGGQWNVQALSPNQYYPPPTKFNANDCLCSSVIYSLLSACGSCQMDEPIAQVDPPTKWSLWCTNCTSSMISLSKYPSHISPETAVPAWAYFDVNTTDRFEAVKASQAVNLLESTVGNNEMSTPSSTSTSIASSETSTPTKSIDTVTMIGIAVGSTIGLGLIVGLVIYILKRDRPRLPLSAVARKRATPDMGTVAGRRSTARHPNILLPSGQSSVGHEQEGPPIPPAVFQFDHMNGSPWSPPPTSSTPTRTMSPTSAQSLLSTHDYGSHPRHDDDGINHRTSSSGPDTADSSENPGRRSSTLSMAPLVHYEGTLAPPLGTSVYATTRQVHVHGAGNRQRWSGSTQSPLSPLPEL